MVIPVETPFLPLSILSAREIVFTKLAVSGACTLIAWCLAVYFIFYVLEIVRKKEETGETVPESSATQSRSSRSRSSSRVSGASLLHDQQAFYFLVTDWCSAICVVAHALWPACLLIQTSGLISTLLSCQILTFIQCEVIGIARTSFYCILALRTRVSFQNTTFELTNRTLGLIVATIFLFIQAQTIWTMVVGPEKLMHVPALEWDVCIITWDFTNVIVYGASDFAMTFFLMNQFGRRLATTLDRTGQFRGEMDSNMLSVLRKWLLLGWVSILGTWFFQCFGLFLAMMEVSGSLDCLLNMVCVIAVYKNALWMYEYGCTGVEKVFVFCCGCCFDVKLLSMDKQEKELRTPLSPQKKVQGRQRVGTLSSDHRKEGVEIVVPPNKQ